MKTKLLIILFGFLLAIPFMYFLAWADPIRESISIKTYLICLVSVQATFYFFHLMIKKSNRDQLSDMRMSGLSDQQIKDIVGTEQFNSMLKA